MTLLRGFTGSDARRSEISAAHGYELLRLKQDGTVTTRPIVAFSIIATAWGWTLAPIALGTGHFRPDDPMQAIRAPDGRVYTFADCAEIQTFSNTDEWSGFLLATVAERVWGEAGYPCEGSA